MSLSLSLSLRLPLSVSLLTYSPPEGEDMGEEGGRLHLRIYVSVEEQLKGFMWKECFSSLLHTLFSSPNLAVASGYGHLVSFVFRFHFLCVFISFTSFCAYLFFWKRSFFLGVLKIEFCPFNFLLALHVHLFI